MLSKRLQAVADMVTPGYVVADVGTDHGYVPIYLVKNNIAPKAYAMDINEGPLQKAKQNIKKEGLEKEIDTILSDGMKGLKPDTAESVIIAGMGGELIVRILKESKVNDTLSEMVLSPHRDVDLVRTYIIESGWHIERETMTIDAGKYYNVMKIMPGEESKKYNKTELMYGRHLLQEKNPILKEYLQKEYNKFKRIHEKMKQNQSRDIGMIEETLLEIRKGLDSYD